MFPVVLHKEDKNLIDFIGFKEKSLSKCFQCLQMSFEIYSAAILAPVKRDPCNLGGTYLVK